MRFQSDESREFIYRPAIVRKGLILVLIPVVLGSGFLFALDYLWFSSNNLVLKDQQQNEVAIAVNESFTALTSYSYRVINSAFSVDQNGKSEAALLRQNVEQKLTRLQKQVDRDAQLFAAEGQIKNSIEDVFGEANKIAATLQTAHITDNMQRIALYGKLMRRAFGLTDQMQAANLKRQALQNDLRKQEESLQSVLKSLLLLAFVCGTAISAFLFFDFAKSILTRIKIVSSNAARLARLEAPAQAVKGNDELAYLDTTFRDVANLLQTARDEQRSVVQMIAHDIRSPVMAAQVSISTFEEFFVDGLRPEAINWCEQINAACNHVLKFVGEFLTLETIQSGAIILSHTDFSIRKLVQDGILELSEEASGKRVTIENHCSGAVLQGDHDRIAQVISSFLHNAIIAAPEGSTIAVNNKAQGDFETITVRDSAPALTKAQSRKAFQRFGVVNQDTSASAKQFGLGLYISKLLIECHGGKVGADSDAGGGRKFWFSLPAKGVSKPFVAYDSSAEEHLLPIKKSKTGLFSLNQSLVGRVLALMVLPVIAQAAWLIWINGQLSKSQELARNEQQQADRLGAVSAVWTTGYRANADTIFYGVFRDSEYRKKARAEIALLKNLSHNLNKQESGDQKEAVLWRDAEVMALNEVKHLDARLKDLGGAPANGNAITSGATETMLTQVPVHIASALDLYGKLERLSGAELRRLASISAENEKFRRQFQNFIYFAIGLNILLAIIQLLAFKLDITRRINILVDNARKLPTRGQLADAMTGSDEIAYLDLLLHQAAHRLIDADRERLTVVQIVADNVGAPIKSMNKHLRMLEADAAAKQDFNAKGLQTLANAGLNIDRVRVLTEDLFETNKITEINNELELSRCRLADIIEESLASITSLAAVKGIKIQTDYTDAGLRVDRGKIIQVLVNLISNAIKFSPEGAHIVVQAECDKRTLRISVKDSGPGMDSAESERIFQKFVRDQKQGQKAFGLGLTICKQIVEAHGGQIGVESEPGTGSTFWFGVPMA